MGWKALRDEFNITHPIHVLHDAQLVCIGTRVKTRIAYICMVTGHIIECCPHDFLKEHYPRIANAKPAHLVNLLKRKDRFGKSVKVYSFDFEKGALVTHHCERTGFFNTTNDGDLMFKGVHFVRSHDALERARLELGSRIEWAQEEVDFKAGALASAQERLREHKSALMRLENI